MEDYRTAAYACFISCENKTRKFFYNDEGVFEGVWKGYDIISFENFKQIVGKPIYVDKIKFKEFYKSLKFGHDVFGKDRTHPTRDNFLSPGDDLNRPINMDAA